MMNTRVQRRPLLVVGVAVASLALLLHCDDSASDWQGGSPAGTGAGALPDAGPWPDAGPPDADGLDAAPDAPVPMVAFVAPAEGATVSNPVLFEIQAAHVDEVEIFADEIYSLGPAWDPVERQTLLYRFIGTGVARSLHVTGRVDGQDVARDDLTVTISPDSCEDRFFVTEFDARNPDPGGTLDLARIREDALAAVRSAVSDLQDCGAGVTLGGMMSLLLYEGGFRAGAYNTLCSENSYTDVDPGCDAVAEALYSYQFGIGAIHTSNFHPCKDVGYTQGMRQRLTELLSAAGLDVDPAIVTPTIAGRFAEVCPDATPTAVDYYILGAHDLFSVPKNGSGNHLAGCGTFPFFDASISVNLTFRPLLQSCSSVTDDRDAIATWGGGDASYGNWDKQTQILALYVDFAASNCQ